MFQLRHRGVIPSRATTFQKIGLKQMDARATLRLLVNGENNMILTHTLETLLGDVHLAAELIEDLDCLIKLL
jgi:hypothetical protein